MGLDESDKFDNIQKLKKLETDLRQAQIELNEKVSDKSVLLKDVKKLKAKLDEKVAQMRLTEKQMAQNIKLQELTIKERDQWKSLAQNSK